MGILHIAAVILLLGNAQAQSQYKVYYRWKKAEFNFPGDQRPSGDEFIEKNVPITALKIYGDVMYLTTPRYKDGVPVTLSTVPYNRRYSWGVFWDDRMDGPKLDPFPSYDMQKVGNCTALQMVQSMELDEYGRLWVVDLGRSSVLEEKPKNSCPARLVVFDVKKRGKNILFTYEFPPEVVSPTENIIKDIQVGCQSQDDCWIYISDLAANRLVVYHTKSNQSWTAQHPTMAPDPQKSTINIDGFNAEVPFGLTGLGLSPRNTNFSTLYFSPLASDKIYRVNTSDLQNPALQQNKSLQASAVQLFGKKPGQSDGFAMTSTGNLYYGVLPEDSVYITKTDGNVQQLGTQTNVAKSEKDLSWPDTFGFDGKGNLLVTSSKFHLWEAGLLNDTDYNYRVIILTKSGQTYPYNTR